MELNQLTLEQIKGLGISDEAIATKVFEHFTEREKLHATIADTRVNKAFTDVDTTIAELTGLQKQADTKTTDFMKTAFTGYVAKQTETTQQEITRLKEELKKQPGDEKLKGKITELETALNAEKDKFTTILTTKENEWKEKYGKIESEYSTHKTKSMLKDVIPANFKTGLPASYIKFEVDNAITEAMKLKIKDDNGTIKLINEETYQAVNASDFFKEKLKDIIEGGRNQPGGGSASGDGKNQESLQITDAMSKEQKISAIKEHILKSGISITSNEYSKKYMELCQQHGILKKPEPAK